MAELASWDEVFDAVEKSKSVKQSSNPTPKAKAEPESWDDVDAAIKEVESGFSQEYLKELKAAEAVAQIGIESAPLGVQEWGAAAALPPEYRRAALERSAELFKERGPMKGAGNIKRTAVAIAQGGVDWGMPAASFFAPKELQLDGDQEAFRQALISVREGSDPSLSEGSIASTIQQAARMAVPMVGMGVAGRASGTLASSAGLGAVGTRIAQGVGVTAAAYPMAADQSYRTMIAEGLDPEIAAPISRISGLFEGAIESVIPDPFKVQSGVLRGSIRRIVAEGVRRAGVQAGRIGIEASEEGAQAFTREAMYEVARAIDEDIPNQGLGQAFVAAAEEGLQSIGPLTVVMGPSITLGALGTARNTASRPEQYRQAIERRDFERFRRELTNAPDAPSQVPTDTESAERLSQLQEIRSKGFVSINDASNLNIEGKNRKDRLANLDKEIEALKNPSPWNDEFLAAENARLAAEQGQPPSTPTADPATLEQSPIPSTPPSGTATQPGATLPGGEAGAAGIGKGLVEGLYTSMYERLQAGQYPGIAKNPSDDAVAAEHARQPFQTPEEIRQFINDGSRPIQEPSPTEVTPEEAARLIQERIAQRRAAQSQPETLSPIGDKTPTTEQTTAPVPQQPKGGDPTVTDAEQVPPSTTTPQGKEPWELTRSEHVAERERRIAEFRRLSDENGGGPEAMKVPEVAEAFRAQEEWSDLDIGHKPSVQKAVKEGKPVPASVLAEYPNIKPKSILNPVPAVDAQSKGTAATPTGATVDRATPAADPVSELDQAEDELAGLLGETTGEDVQASGDVQELPQPKHPDEVDALPKDSLYRTTAGGKKFIAVRGEGKRGGGDRLFETVEAANAHIERQKIIDQQNEEVRKKREEREAAESKQEADYVASFQGFKQDNPREFGRARKVLDTQRNYRDKVQTRKQIIEQSVADGAKVLGGRLERPDGTSLGEDAITKIGIQYAEHLIAARLRSDAAKADLRGDSEMSEALNRQADKLSNPESKWQSETRAKLDAVPALKGSKFDMDEEAGTVKVTRPDDIKVTIHFKHDEKIKEWGKKKGFNPEKTYGWAVKTNAGEIGIFVRSDANHTNVLNHEMMHALEFAGIVTKEEVEQYGGREAIAEKYGKWAEVKLRKKDSVFQKIYDALEAVFSSQRKFFEEVGARQAAKPQESLSQDKKPSVPSYRDWRFTSTAKNAGKVIPNKVGAKFLPDQMQAISDWAKSEGYSVSNVLPTGISINDPSGKRLDIAMAGVAGVKAEASKASSERRQANEQKADEDRKAKADGRKSAAWIADIFGDAMNDYNRNALSDYLEGDTKKFEGMISDKWRSGFEKLKAISGEGRIDWKTVLDAYDYDSKNAASPEPTKGTNSSPIGDDSTQASADQVNVDSGAESKVKTGSAKLPWLNSSPDQGTNWHGTKVSVAPSNRREEPYSGQVVRVLNRGEMVEVQPDGQDGTFRVDSARITLAESAPTVVDKPSVEPAAEPLPEPAIPKFTRTTPDKGSITRQFQSERVEKARAEIADLEKKARAKRGEHDGLRSNATKKRAAVRKDIEFLNRRIHVVQGEIAADFAADTLAKLEDELESPRSYDHYLAGMRGIHRLKAGVAEDAARRGEMGREAARTVVEKEQKEADRLDAELQSRAKEIAMSKGFNSGDADQIALSASNGFTIFEDRSLADVVEVQGKRTRESRVSQEINKLKPESSYGRQQDLSNEQIEEFTKQYQEASLDDKNWLAKRLVVDTAVKDAIEESRAAVRKREEEERKEKEAQRAKDEQEALANARERAKKYFLDERISKALKKQKPKTKPVKLRQESGGGPVKIVEGKTTDGDQDGELYPNGLILHKTFEEDSKDFVLTHARSGSGFPFSAKKSDMQELIGLLDILGLDFNVDTDEKGALPSELTSRVKKINTAWDNGDYATLSEQDYATVKSLAEVAKTDIDADLILTADDLGANGIPPGLDKVFTDRGLRVVKGMAEEVPEFAYDPVFTVKDGMLLYRDGYEFNIDPTAFNLHPSELKEGQTVGINLEDLGINRATPQDVVAEVMKGTEIPRVTKTKGGAVSVGYVGARPTTLQQGENDNDWSVVGGTPKVQEIAVAALKKIRWRQPGQDGDPKTDIDVVPAEKESVVAKKESESDIVTPLDPVKRIENVIEQGRATGREPSKAMLEKLDDAKEETNSPMDSLPENGYIEGPKGGKLSKPQFEVGERVQVGNSQGVVESVNLRWSGTGPKGSAYKDSYKVRFDSGDLANAGSLSMDGNDMKKAASVEPVTETPKPIPAEVEFMEMSVGVNAPGVNKTIRVTAGDRTLLMERSKHDSEWSIREGEKYTGEVKGKNPVKTKSAILASGIVETKKAKEIAQRIIDGTFDKDADNRFVREDTQNIGLTNAGIAESMKGSLGGKRDSFAKLLREQGLVTDGRILMKVNDKDRDAILKGVGETFEGRSLSVVAQMMTDGQKALSRSANAMKPIGYRGGYLTPRTVVLQSQDGDSAIIDKSLHDTILKKYPNAVPYFLEDGKPISYAVDGDLVAIVMPMNMDKPDAKVKALVAGKYDFDAEAAEAAKFPPPQPKTKLKKASEKANKELSKAVEMNKLEAWGQWPEDVKQKTDPLPDKKTDSSKSPRSGSGNSLNEFTSPELQNRQSMGAAKVVVASAADLVGDEDVAAGSQHASPDGEFERRWQQATKGIGKKTLATKLREFWNELVKSTVRGSLPELPRTKQFGEARSAMHAYQNAPTYAQLATADLLKKTTKPLSAKDYDLFTRIVIMRDQVEAADRGERLSYGLTPAKAKAELDRLEALAEKNERVQASLEYRRQWTEAMVDDFLSAHEYLGLDMSDRFKRENYFRHQVLYYMEAQQRGLGKKKVELTPNRGWLKGRTSGEDLGENFDINANYLQAEWEVATQMIADTKRAQAIGRLKRHYDKMRQLKEEAKYNNYVAVVGGQDVMDEIEELRGRMEEMRAQGSLDSGEKAQMKAWSERLWELDPTMPFRRDMAIAKDKIERGASNLGEEVPDEFVRYAKSLAERDGHPLQTLALKFLKAMSDRKAFIKNALGNDYQTWEDVVPDDYEEVAIRPGRAMFQAYSVSEQVASELMADLSSTLGISAEDLRPITAMGSKYTPLVVPQEVAAQMMAVDNKMDFGWLDRIVTKPMNAWKRWVLMAPTRILKYNLRNLSEVDKVMALNPAALREVPQAIQDLWKLYSGADDIPSNVRDWVERGGTTTLVQVNELGEVNELKEFAKLVSDKKSGIVGKMVKSPIDAWKKYWSVANISSNFRESILRYAAYLSYIKQLEAGKLTNYGGSVRAEVDGIKDNKDKAMRLSADLLGDYSDISLVGQFMRSRIAPFWSFQETNVRTYFRGLMNLASNEQSAIKAGMKIARAAGFAGLAKTPFLAYKLGRIAILFYGLQAMATAFNQLLFPDDDDDLPEDEKRRAHLTFGKNSNGEVQYFSRIGTAADVLDWIGLDSVDYDLRDVLDGRRTVRDIMNDMVRSPVDKAYGMLSPFMKAPAELAVGQTAYPQVGKPRPIRDRAEYIAKNLGIEKEYDKLVGNPSTPYAISDLVLYKVEPGTSVYYMTLDAKSRWLKTARNRGVGYSESARGNAMRNYKMALRLNDKVAADKYLAEFTAAGGTKDGMLDSLESSHPAGGLSTVDSILFYNELEPVEKDEYRRAEQFYYSELLTEEQATAIRTRREKRIKDLASAKNKDGSPKGKPEKTADETAEEFRDRLKKWQDERKLAQEFLRAQSAIDLLNQ